MFTFDQLRAFVAVAEELHFGRAAERLQMTQPPLSRAIQKLERVVGAELLERDNRTVRLTAAGQAFLFEAQRLLVLASSSVEETRRIQSGSAGTVHLGFTATAAFGVLTTLLNLITTSLPDVHLELSEMVTRKQTAQLLAGELDLGLARPPFDSTTFDSRLVHREGLRLAVPAGHTLAGASRAVRPAEIAGQPVIMHSPVEARYFHDLVVRHLPVAEEDVVHTVSQVLTMMCLVAGGRGLAFVPASASRIGIDGVRLLPIERLPAEPVELHLLWARDNRNPAARAIIDHVVAAAPAE